MNKNNMNDIFNNVKKMVDSGASPNDILNSLPPDFINNMNSMFNSNNQNNNSNFNNSTNTSPNNNYSNNQNHHNNNQSNNSQYNFNLDPATILKIKSIMDNINNTNDPRANLLYSLKPYLRNGRKEKIDQYVNMLNMTKLAELMKNDNNTSNK